MISTGFHVSSNQSSPAATKKARTAAAATQPAITPELRATTNTTPMDAAPTTSTEPRARAAGLSPINW